MKQKVIITGSNGLLGQELISLFTKDVNFEVFGISKGKNRIIHSEKFTYYNVNITDKSEVTKVLKAIKPDFIIHGAAMTNVDLCEVEQKKCDVVNVKATSYFVDFCKKNNSHFIFISTDFIFDGKQGFYSETDRANPVNYYGLSKLQSENYIQKKLINFTILRTILVFGKPENSTKSNIVLWIKDSLENNKKITIITDQYRMPTYSKSLAKACLLSVKKRAKGIFHISSNKLLSIYEIALQIATVFKLNPDLIVPITTKELKQKAKRPKKTGFNLKKSITLLDFTSKSFKEELLLFKTEYFH